MAEENFSQAFLFEETDDKGLNLELTLGGWHATSMKAKEVVEDRESRTDSELTPKATSNTHTNTVMEQQQQPPIVMLPDDEAYRRKKEEQWTARMVAQKRMKDRRRINRVAEYIGSTLHTNQSVLTKCIRIIKECLTIVNPGGEMVWLPKDHHLVDHLGIVPHPQGSSTSAMNAAAVPGQKGPSKTMKANGPISMDQFFRDIQAEMMNAAGGQPNTAAGGILRGGQVITPLMKQIPFVSTKAYGPKGTRAEGIVFKYKIDVRDVNIICICHGNPYSFLAFVRHAGGSNVKYPLRNIIARPTPIPNL